MKINILNMNNYCYIHSVLYVPFTFIGNSVLSIADYIKSTSGRQL